MLKIRYLFSASRMSEVMSRSLCLKIYKMTSISSNDRLSFVNYHIHFDRMVALMAVRSRYKNRSVISIL